MTLRTQGLQTLEEVRAVLDGTEPFDFEAPGRAAAYDCTAEQLRRFGDLRLGRADRGPGAHLQRTAQSLRNPDTRTPTLASIRNRWRRDT